MRSWCATGVLALVGLALPSARADPPGHGVGADVHGDGSTLVITVPLTVLVRGDLADAAKQQALAERLQQAAGYWNKGLSGFRYFDCFTLQIDVEPTFVHPVNRDFEAPGHVVRTYGSSFVGTMADGRQLPSVLDPAGVADATLDYEGPFEHRVEAYWPPWLFEDVASLAHELGHLVGLGDDYTRDEGGDVAALDGRDGTLMDGGDAIDSVLAQRVGDQIIGAGYADAIPQCWKASATIASTAAYPDLQSSTCRDAWMFDFTFVVGADGAVSGDGSAHATTPATCPFDAPGVQWDTVHFTVSGRRQGPQIALGFTQTSFEPPAGINYGGLGSVFSGGGPGGALLVLPIAGGTITGPASWSTQSGSPPATYSATGTVQATCTASCEAAG